MNIPVNLPKPCNNFEEDPFVCDDVGEPKGQCIHCGFKDWDHRPDWQKFYLGDIARAKKEVEFFDRTKHIKGDCYPINNDNIGYFNVCQEDYEKVDFKR